MDVKNIFKVKNAPCGICEDMVMLFLVTFGYAAITYEGWMPQAFTSIYTVFFAAVFALSWLCISFKSGSRGRWQIAVFAVIFWLLPQLVIFLANDGPRAFRLSVPMYVLSEFGMFISSVPGKLAGKVFGAGDLGGAVISAVISLVFYCGGTVFTVLSKKNNEAEALPDPLPVSVGGTRFKTPSSEDNGDDEQDHIY